MKKVFISTGSKLFLLFLSLTASVCALAQDGGATTETSTVNHSASTAAPDNTAMWFNNPVVWIVGGLAVVLILVAIFSGRKNTSTNQISRSTTTTTKIEND